MTRPLHLAGVGVLAALAILPVGCGGDGADTPFDCDLTIVVETAEPSVGSAVTARVVSNELGFLNADWSLELDMVELSCTDESSGLCEGQTIAFVPAEAGTYDISVSGNVDGVECSGDSTTINVGTPGAILAAYRVRVSPVVGAPIQEKSLTIPGGSDFFAGDLRLAAGITAGGSVLDSQAAGVGAHLRAVSGTFALDGFADGSGVYSLSLAAGDYDVNVFPADPTLAPARLAQVDPSSLGDISLDAGAQVTGTITAPGGGALVGARAILRHDDVPSTVGTTGGAGDFSVAARVSGAGRLTVTPPAGSGLPVLEGAAANVADGSSVAVSYATASVLVARTLRVQTSGGTPVPGARVTFVSAPISAAATLRVDGGGVVNLDGRAQTTAISNGAGDAIVSLPDADYTIVIETPAAGTSVLSTDLTGGVSPALAIADGPSSWQATIVDDVGAPVFAATVIARPVGALSLHPGSGTAAQSAADGTVALDLVGNGSYQIQIDPPTPSGARLQRGVVVAVPSGIDPVGTIAVPRAQQITGTVTLPSGAGAAHAPVAFFCEACATPEIPVAETVTDAAGRWVITLPDAGVEMP